MDGGRLTCVQTFRCFTDLSERMIQDVLQHMGESTWPVLSYHVIVYVSIISLVYICSRAVYNTFFHPLSVYPGPIWATITPFYLTYLFATKKSHLKTKELHEKYGSVVRLGPNLISFSDPKLLPEVYHRKAEKTAFYSTGLAGEVAPLLQIQSHDAHAAKMKVLGPTYSMKNIKLLEPEVDQRVMSLMDTLRQRHVYPNTEADLSEYTRWFVYDTISQLIYGEPIGFVEQSTDVENLIQSWHDMFFLGGLVATLPWLIHPLITSWPLKRWIMPHRGLSYGSGHIMSVHERIFKNRLAHPELAQPGNIFDSFMNSHDEKYKPFTITDAARECFLLTVASQDTTAAFISPLISYIATNPRVYDKLMTEIRQFERAGKLSTPARYDEISALSYFQACIRESLRRRPPVPIILPRLAPKGGMMLEGHFVAEGTELGANPWIIHQDTEVFGPDVDVFRPERWLHDDSDDDKARVRRMMKYDFTWGYGGRKCVGKNIALMDGSKFVLQLFREFEVAPVDMDKPWGCENWGIHIYFDQRVRLRPRIG